MLIRPGQGGSLPSRPGPADTDRQDTMRRVAEFSIRHRWAVVIAWLFLTVVGALTAGPAVGRLDYTYTTPGQPGYEANLHITQRFGIDATFEPTLALRHD